VLCDTYSLPGAVSLTRLRPELAGEFTSAFSEVEEDLRQWMPAAAREQENAAEFIDRCVDAFEAADTFAYAITTRDGQVIGYSNLTPEADHAAVGYWVRPDSRGKGVASTAVGLLSAAAFDLLPAVASVHAYLDAANVASRRALEKAGFRHHEAYTRPPRTSAETDTEWLYVKDRHDRGTETDRLVLRDLAGTDLDHLIRLWTDGDVARFMGDLGPRTATGVDAWIGEAVAAARLHPRFRSWVMESKDTGEVVGWIGFGGDSRGIADMDFAYIVEATHRRNGYAAEALRGAVDYCFATLGARSFWGQCHTDNPASGAAMEAAGLEFIGTVDGQHRYRISRT
jgi:ribosomal-protein-alanine N-acetyltransferase